MHFTDCPPCLVITSLFFLIENEIIISWSLERGQQLMPLQEISLIGFPLRPLFDDVDDDVVSLDEGTTPSVIGAL
jgi:hypothetical protein